MEYLINHWHFALNHFVLRWVILLASIGLITKGADWFTDAAVNIAEVTRIPKVIIGATIVSMATTMPEFTVSFIATIMGSAERDIAVGNALGSCVCNIGLILGTCLLIRPMMIQRAITFKQAIFMIGTGLLVTGFGLIGKPSSLYPGSIGLLSRIEGIILVIGLIGYIYFSLNIAKRERVRNVEGVATERPVVGDKYEGPQIELFHEFLWFFIGAACVISGSTGLVQSSSRIAEAFGVPKLIISITLVALGTSLPEYVTALMATIKGYQELSVGNIIGADILDIVWVLGGCSLVGGLPIQYQTKVLDFPAMLTLMLLLVIFGMTKGRWSRKEGGIILAVYIVYMIIMFVKFLNP